MRSCLETDAVVTLARLADDPLELLRHALDCERCREALAEVAVLRREAGVAVAARAGFTDDVMEALPAPTGPARSASTSTAWTWWPILGGLGSAVGFFVAAAAGAAAPVAVGQSLILACLLAAGGGVLAPGVTAQWSRRGS